MSAANECTHEHCYWYPAINEEGWKCANCGTRPGEPPGYSPRLDRNELFTKVSGLLNDLHNANLIYVSNGTMGEYLTAEVVRACREAGTFDQYSIIKAILDHPEMAPSHAEFWKPIGESIISGNDTRARCACGQLGTISSGNENVCRDCWGKAVAK